MDRLMIDYLRSKGMGGMNEQEFKHRFKDFMTKYRRNSMGGGSSSRGGYSRNAMRHGGEGSFFPMERMDDFYRHGRTDNFMEMDDFDRFNRHNMEDDEMYNMMKYMRHSMNEGEHFNDSEAKYLVAEMYHVENGRKHTGEKFDMHKAKEICERYRGILPTSVTPADVYVAINTQYHDYAELYKNWFGDNIDQKVIESAIVFWFKDADCKVENKVVEYLKEY